MRTIVTDVVAWSVGRSVCHDREFCKNGSTDRDAVLDMDSDGPKQGCTFAQPGEYDRSVHVQRRCGLISNFFDNLFSFAAVLHLLKSTMSYNCNARNVK